MDTPVDEVCRGERIDRVRQNILDQTSLTFLPRRQTQFMSDYADLPGDCRMTVRDRIKLIADDYRRKFLGRMETVIQHSTQAENDKVTEFNWEADAWRDIFGRMRDDDRLRMDKREYNYRATILNAPRALDTYMGKRIPDITFGLSSYRSADPDDEGVDERERRIRRPLQAHILRSITSTQGADSLILDGKWGQHTILFPFAVYEAKKNDRSDITVKVQLKLALNAYLRMMDRLVRQPGNTTEYQWPQSRAFSVFGFTSSGSVWRIYVGYLPICVKEDAPAPDDALCDEHSHMKLIWEGNVSEPQPAGEFLDMVDQIHEYAVTTHRPFVSNHLVAWTKYVWLQMELCRRGEFDLLPSLASEHDSEIEWFWIKFKSAKVRKLLKKQKKGDDMLTDDDVYRSSLEAKLKVLERGRQRDLLAGGTDQQPLRRSKRIPTTYRYTDERATSE